MTAGAGNEAKFEQAARKPGRPRGTSVGGYLEIAAPPEIVWEILGDWKNWGTWNPLYTRTAGELREGAEIDMTVCVEGMKPMDTLAKVFTVRPGECIEYGLSKAGGLLRAFRFAEIEEIAPDRCAIANGETMSGPVGWIVAKLAGAKVGQGLRAMNEKLKERAEAKWRSGGG